MADGSAHPVQAARPSIEIDGQADSTLTASLLVMDVMDSDSGLARCELLLGNWGGPTKAGFQHFDRNRLEFGKGLKVKLGDDALFEGKISAIRGVYPEGAPPQIGVCAEDRLQDLRMTRRTRCFAAKTAADVIRTIASDHGLKAQVNFSGEQHTVLAQVNQSDLAFVREIARREEAQVWAEGSNLKASRRTARSGAAVELDWAGKLREFDVVADLANQRTSVAASGWDISAKEAVKHTADEQPVSSELGNGESGVALVQRAFGDRADTLAHGLPADAAQAKALAEASLRHIGRRFVVGRGVAETRADLRVGAKVKLGGLGPLFEGEYVVTRIHHRYDAARGLRTEFECDRAAVGKASPA